MSAQYSSQSGMVLVTSLVILMILTMLGLSSVQGTSIQELISRNQRDSNIAFNAAETTHSLNAEATLSGLTLSAADWQSIVGKRLRDFCVAEGLQRRSCQGLFLRTHGRP